MMTDPQINDLIATLDRPVLRLTLHRQWFDLIALGLKTEEYRECKPYWDRRFRQSAIKGDKHTFGFLRIGGEEHKARGCYVLFSNGYGKGCRKMLTQITSVQLRQGDQPGAPKEPCWVISFSKLDFLNFSVCSMDFVACEVDWEAEAVKAYANDPNLSSQLVFRICGERVDPFTCGNTTVLPREWRITDPVRYGEQWVGVTSGNWWAMIPRHWITVQSEKSDQ